MGCAWFRGLIALAKQIILDGLYPLGRVGDLECGTVPMIVFIDEIDFHDRLMKVDTFEAVIGIYVSDFISGDS